jgi:signal transduction histidine kinase
MYADCDAVEQAILNLLSNAMKYSQSWTLRFSSAHRTEACIRLRIAESAFFDEQKRVPEL